MAGKYESLDREHPERQRLYLRHDKEEGPLHPNTLFRNVDRLRFVPPAPD
jgi:hypothetical protein